MGVLTETTMRLRKEMAAWRQIRVELQDDLVRQTGERRRRVSALCAGFARDRAGAHRAWYGPPPSERASAPRHQQHRPAWGVQPEVPHDSVQPEGAHREPAKHVPAAGARPPVAHLPQSPRPPFKGPKKH
ncbi:MAG: hypothetical protein ABSH31_18675 [Bryobacteraceae bacterium]